MFAGVFPVDSTDFPKLEESIKRVYQFCPIATSTYSLDLILAYSDGSQCYSPTRIIISTRTGLPTRLFGHPSHGCIPTATWRWIWRQYYYYCSNGPVQELVVPFSLAYTNWHGHLVVYRDKEVFVSNPTEFPETIDVTSRVKEVQEPIVKASVIVPEGGRGFWLEIGY